MLASLATGLALVISACSSDAPEKPALTLLPRPALAGLRPWLAGGEPPESTFRVAGEELVISGAVLGYLATERTDFGDLTLSFEWMWVIPGNSGLFLYLSGPDRIWPKTLEVQLLPGFAGDFLALSGLEMRATPDGPLIGSKARTQTVERPTGEWNRALVEIGGGVVRVTINDVAVNEVRVDASTRGSIAFEAEGGEIHFRRTTVREP